MKYRVALASGLLLLVISTATHAADLIVEAPPVVPEQLAVDWTGIYAGVHGGWGSGYAFNTDYEDQGRDIEGFLAGVQAGANAQFGGFVLGVEGDVSWSNINVEDPTETGDLSLTANWLATLRARAGYAFDGLLLYGTAGLASAEFTYAIDVFSEPVSHEDTHSHVGWVAGLGIEAMLAENISVKAEYLHRDFEAETYQGYEAEDLAARMDTFTVGANFHF